MAVDLGFDADATVLAEVDPSLAGYDTTAGHSTVLRRRRAPSGDAARRRVRWASAPVVPMGMIQHQPRRCGAPGIDVPAGRAAGDTRGRARVRCAVQRRERRLLRGDGRPPARRPHLHGRRSLRRRRRRRWRSSTRRWRGRLWPAGDALGQRIQFETRERRSAPAYEVVGIVAPTHRTLFEAELPGRSIVPFAQGPHEHRRSSTSRPGGDGGRRPDRRGAARRFARRRPACRCSARARSPITWTPRSSSGPSDRASACSASFGVAGDDRGPGRHLRRDGPRRGAAHP